MGPRLTSTRRARVMSKHAGNRSHTSRERRRLFEQTRHARCLAPAASRKCLFYLFRDIYAATFDANHAVFVPRAQHSSPSIPGCPFRERLARRSSTFIRQTRRSSVPFARSSCRSPNHPTRRKRRSPEGAFKTSRWIAWTASLSSFKRQRQSPSSQRLKSM
jgi:hypothetical protein